MRCNLINKPEMDHTIYAICDKVLGESKRARWSVERNMKTILLFPKLDVQ